MCEDTENTIDTKYNSLMCYIEKMGKAIVAYSGGVDSSLLLKAATDVLHDNALAVMVRTEVTIGREVEAAKSFCSSIGVVLHIIDLSLLSASQFISNPPNRCYICKKAMFIAIKKFAKPLDIFNIMEGTNKSDIITERPGFIAIAEEGVTSPLRECALTKADVRTLSKKLHLNTWDLPSNSCLATRFPYNETLTTERLAIVERAEDFLVANGIRQVRVKVGAHNE